MNIQDETTVNIDIIHIVWYDSVGHKHRFMSYIPINWGQGWAEILTNQDLRETGIVAWFSTQLLACTLIYEYSYNLDKTSVIPQ